MIYYFHDWGSLLVLRVVFNATVLLIFCWKEFWELSKNVSVCDKVTELKYTTFSSKLIHERILIVSRKLEDTLNEFFLDFRYCKFDRCNSSIFWLFGWSNSRVLISSLGLVCSLVFCVSFYELSSFSPNEISIFQFSRYAVLHFPGSFVFQISSLMIL